MHNLASVQQVSQSMRVFSATSDFVSIAWTNLPRYFLFSFKFRPARSLAEVVSTDENHERVNQW
jgi:hypothetical protein